MSSPVTGDSFIVATPGGNLCTKFTNLLNLAKVMKTFFDWAFTSGGAVTNPHKALFLPPEGMVSAYYSTDQDIEAVRAVVEGWYRDEGDAGIPFYRLCDGTDGTPNLIGKTLVGVGTAASETSFSAGVAGGAEKVTLAATELPDHQHTGKAYEHYGYTGENPSDPGIIDDPMAQDGQQLLRHHPGAQHSGFTMDTSVQDHLDSFPANVKTSGVLADLGTPNGQPHQNMPPYMPVYYVIRTSRVA